MSERVHVRPIGTCRECGKGDYLTRGAAKKAAKKRAPGDHFNAYPCPTGSGYYHYGHLPAKVLQARMPRALLVPGRTLTR